MIQGASGGLSLIKSLSTVDPSSGREIPAISHGAGVWHGHFTPRILVLGMGRFQAGVVFLAWIMNTCKSKSLKLKKSDRTTKGN